MSASAASRRRIERCPVCGASARSPWLMSLGFALARCEGCGHKYAEEVLSAADLAGDYYDEPDADIAARSLSAKRARFSEYLRTLEGLFARPGRVLDVGCNAGELLGFFQEIGWKVAGVEPSPGPAAFARTRLGAPIWEGDAEVALPEGELFDLITMTHVMEHVIEPGRLLARLRRALSPGGALLIEVPNADDALLSVWGGYYRPLCPGDHVSFFNERSMRRLLDEGGFEVRSVESPIHARDVVYGSALSAADFVRDQPRSILAAPGGSSGSGGSAAAGVKAQTRYRGPLRAPLRKIVDGLVSAIDPLVVMAGSSLSQRGRGPVLIVTAIPAKSG